MAVTTWEKVSVVLAGLALAASGISIVIAEQGRRDALVAANESRRIAEEANKFSRDSNDISADAYALSAHAAEVEIASRVFLGEAPPKYERRGNPIWAVSNNSGVDVTRVWVEGNDRDRGKSYTEIGHIQQCHLYTLADEPGKFFPSWVHFFDGSQHWKRHLDGRIEVDKAPKIPLSLPKVGAPDVYQMVGTCGG